jgi:precorrin-6B methylase 2
MARDKDFDLRAALAKPSFTPGQRDIAALVELIASDEDAAVHAAPALAKLGDAALAAVIAGVANAANDDGAAARLTSVLGLMARAGHRVARGELIARLGDVRVRVRRAAIVALGKLGATRATRDDRRASEDDDDVRIALIARWDAPDVPPDERRALAEALGKIGGDGVRERLESLDAREDKELERRRDRALLVADREGKRGEDSEVLVDQRPPRALVVRLGCRPALAELLIAEARAAGFDGKAVRDDAVDVPLAGAWQMLFASRLWATAAIRVEDRGLRAHARSEGTQKVHRANVDRASSNAGRASARMKDDRASVTDAIVRAVLSDEVRGLMTAWTRGPIRWRLSLARGHQRAVVWNVAKEVTKNAPGLINDPTQTTWDIRVDDEEGVLELVPRRAPDPRFAYRVAEVPAASHPSVAAAVAWLAGIAKGDTVWDPFCGSGLELVECALRGAGVLVGSDLDDEALAAARANLDAAGIARASLVRGDARRFAPDTLVDAIVTNPPLGSRVHVDAGALLAEALPHFARQLKPGGRLVWITPQWRRTTPAAEAQGLVLVRSLFVDLGGVRGRLERWDRRR